MLIVSLNKIYGEKRNKFTQYLLTIYLYVQMFQPKWNVVIFWLKHEKNWNLRNSFKYNTKIQHHDWCMSTYTYKHTSHHGHRIVFYVNKHSMLMMIMVMDPIEKSIKKSFFLIMIFEIISRFKLTSILLFIDFRNNKNPLYEWATYYQYVTNGRYVTVCTR